MMAPSSDKVVTTLRLTPAKHRELRMAVASRGTSMQKVLEQAIDSWLIREGDERRANRPRLRLRGILRGTDVLQLRKKERRAEIRRDRKRI